MKFPDWRQWLPTSDLEKDLGEVKRLTVKYLREETIDPLRAAGRFALFGALGSAFVAIGAALVMLGVLRFLQDQFPVLDGTLSWIPYLVVAALGLMGAALALWRVVAGAGKKRLGGE